MYKEYKEAVERKNFINIMRKTGMTFQQIGEELGISKGRAHQIHNTEYKEKNFKPKTGPFTGLPDWRKRGRERVRYLVRMRDNFTCQDCGRVWQDGERHFDVHHLNGLCGKKSRGYDRKEDMEGLITLCHKCHYNRPEHKVKKAT